MDLCQRYKAISRSATAANQMGAGSGTPDTTGVKVAAAKLDVYICGDVVAPVRSIENSESAPVGSVVAYGVRVESKRKKEKESGIEAGR